MGFKVWGLRLRFWRGGSGCEPGVEVVPRCFVPSVQGLGMTTKPGKTFTRLVTHRFASLIRKHLPAGTFSGVCAGSYGLRQGQLFAERVFRSQTQCESTDAVFTLLTL